jgi:hypothetical protein
MEGWNVEDPIIQHSMIPIWDPLFSVPVADSPPGIRRSEALAFSGHGQN